MKYDKEVFLTILTQFASLFSPLLFFWYVTYSSGRESIVEFEAVLSLVAFYSLIQDYGTSYFLSYRAKSQTLTSKLLGTSIVLKLILTTFFGIIVFLIFLITNLFIKEFIYSFLILLVLCFDAPFMFFAKKKSHLYSLLLALKLPLALFFLIFISQPLMSYLFATIIICLLSFLYSYIQVKKKLTFSTRMLFFILKKYRVFTLTDALTAVFSQLDGFIVAKLLNSEHAYIYLLVRKFIRAANSLLNYVYRIIYLRTKVNDTNSNLVRQVYFFNAFVVFVFNIFIFFFSRYFFEFDAETFELLIFVSLSQSLVLLVGSVKVIIRNSKIFVSEQFVLHFYATLISTLLFIFPLMYMYFSGFFVSAIFISIIRVLSDVWYLLTIFFNSVYKAKKYN